MRRLSRYVGDKEIPAGGFLVEQGEFSWAFFVIVEGEAEVVRDGEHLAMLGPGDFLGETGVMHRARRNASVVATSDLTVAYLTARALRSVLRKTPSLSSTLERAIEERSRILVAAGHELRRRLALHAHRHLGQRAALQVLAQQPQHRHVALVAVVHVPAHQHSLLHEAEPLQRRQRARVVRAGHRAHAQQPELAERERADQRLRLRGWRRCPSARGRARCRRWRGGRAARSR